MTNKAKEVLGQIQTALNREVDGEIDRAFDALFSGDDTRQHGQLPEDVFKNNFLGYFTGLVQDNHKLNLMTSWIAIAGGVQNPVDILDKKGDTIFTVPPVMSSSFLRTNQPNVGPSFNDIAREARRRSMSIPQAGDRTIGVDGPLKVNTFKVTVNAEEEAQWKKVFDHYGVKTNMTHMTVSNKEGDDDLIYD